MDIVKMIDEIRSMPDCIVHSPCGQPLLDEEVNLPMDLKMFYENCGGISLFLSKEYGFTIVSPKEMVLANPIIVDDLCEEDISSKWYIVCNDSENNYITIDLAEERAGRCYDSFWDRHGVVGECAIIAKSFTELVIYLLKNEGKSLYWLDSNFQFIGDAYDEN
ncbi:SMI1/KNR4 family protein [Anaerosporobacter sp.]|uniref:SMI1/KNR4 family protein n=1 Tax=Anaerosporobacter sp. TaxID=1872529 RepID=UPI00286F5F72|nr:SMI1/KNR4 family protein [Anaerosporobacter sp.]